MTNRRTVLGLLGGGVALGALPALRARAADSAVGPTSVGDRALEIQFDPMLRSRIIARSGSRDEPITTFAPTEFAVTDAGVRIEDFALNSHRVEQVADVHGRGSRHVFQGVADGKLEKAVEVRLYERYPGFAFVRVSYRNISGGVLSLARWVNGAHRLNPSGDDPGFWSYNGASHEDRRDWVQPARPGFAQRNFMGMNASDYGGGTPVVDVWRRDVGLAVGHVESRPRLVALPLEVTGEGARIAVDCDIAIRLAPGEAFETPQTFVAIHRGDYFATLETLPRGDGGPGPARAETLRGLLRTGVVRLGLRA